MYLLRLILFATLSIGGVTNAAAESGNAEHGGYVGGVREILDVETEAELRFILREVGQNLIPSDCSDWAEDKPRVAAVMTLGTFKELWIGRKYSDSNGLGIEGLHRRYEIQNLSMGGSPLRGNIDIRLPVRDMDSDRECFAQLKGVRIKGSNDEDKGVYRSGLWEMTIDNISFVVLVKPQDLSGQRIPTGEAQVTIAVSEGLLSMALRKSGEHLWALPGSLGLLILWAIWGRILRKIREKWRARSTTDPNV